MKIDLADTTASGITSALLDARRHSGSPAMGMVLTLVVVAEEATIRDAMLAAAQAAHEHPARVLGVIIRGGRGAARLEASVRVGGEAASGESVLMRFYGELSRHADSVVMPLLLPESPVVVWWPGRPPANMSTDPIGSLAQRRVADTSAGSRPLATLRNVSANYAPGDTDLAWTRLTPWRTLLAASLDQHPARVAAATVEAASGSASAPLLAAWLSQRLEVDARVIRTGGPGITAVRLEVPGGEIAITRSDGRLARYSVPGQPVRSVALRRRDIAELLSEELRRLDPDDIYAQTVQEYLARTDATGRRATTGRSAAKKASAKRPSATKTSTKKALATKKAPATKTAAKKTSTTKTSTRRSAGPTRRSSR